LTVTEGSVAKYDDLMATLIERYGCNEYISGLYSQVSKWVGETFESQELGKQQSLW
jgi:DNA polymerase II large subunit